MSAASMSRQAVGAYLGLSLKNLQKKFMQKRVNIYCVLKIQLDI